jgi:Group II intron, maturase-specific domain
LERLAADEPGRRRFEPAAPFGACKTLRLPRPGATSICARCHPDLPKDGSLKDKIRACTHRTSQQPPRDALIRLNQIMRGWANYFKHAVCKHTSMPWRTSPGTG